VVIFDDKKTIELYRRGGYDKLERTDGIESSLQPLSVVFTSDSSFMVLITEPDYIAEFAILANKIVKKDCSAVSRALQAQASGIIMPTSVMESDKHGQVKLRKKVEERGHKQEKPWHRVERIQKFKESRSRRSKRRRDVA
jgi:hypothetical protein